MGAGWFTQGQQYQQPKNWPPQNKIKSHIKDFKGGEKK
jgi:hypothetical protein